MPFVERTRRVSRIIGALEIVGNEKSRVAIRRPEDSAGGEMADRVCDLGILRFYAGAWSLDWNSALVAMDRFIINLAYLFGGSLYLLLRIKTGERPEGTQSGIYPRSWRNWILDEHDEKAKN